jgi:1-acyl-sn-glycerol-3-phosphate acyltransferase
VINHIGYMDFTYAGLAARKSGRLVRFMAKESVFTHPVSGPLMRGMHHIPVDRTAGAASYRAAVEALRAGEIVGVFPEATISRSFELKEFKTGAARMAAEAGVPLLPVVIWGSQRVWTKGHPKRLGRTNTPISVSVGEPIPVPADADPVQVTEGCKAVMQDMLDVLRATYEPLTGADLKFLPASMGGTAPTLAEATRLDDAEADERRRRASERRADEGRP